MGEREHDETWAREVKGAISDERLSLHHVAPDRPLPPGNHPEAELNAWNARAEHEPELLASYVAKPGSLEGGAFDFVLVDGRARRFCIREGFGLLRAGGLLILHDAQRTDYHDSLRALGKRRRELRAQPTPQLRAGGVHDARHARRGPRAARATASDLRQPARARLAR